MTSDYKGIYELMITVFTAGWFYVFGFWIDRCRLNSSSAEIDYALRI
jgi:hypothetical protein